MKNITRRGFLQLTAATALVCAAAPLTGCGKKNIKKLDKKINMWYIKNKERLIRIGGALGCGSVRKP